MTGSRRSIRIGCLLAGAGLLAVATTCPASAETRTYSYNARGELTASGVSGGPASGVQTSTGYDAAGNRTTYRTTGSNSPPIYRNVVTVPLNGMTQIITPQ